MKKLILTCLLVFISVYSFAQYTVQIGNGNNGGFNPVTTAFDYNWSLMMYTQPQINASGTINSIDFYQSYTQSGYTMTNQKIFIGFTSLSSLPLNYVLDTANMIHVYSGSITWSGPGWQTIPFSTPVNYYNNPNNNLLVLYWNGNGSDSTPYPIGFRHTAVSVNTTQVLTLYSNVVSPNLTGGNPDASMVNTRLNMSISRDVGTMSVISPTQYVNAGIQNITAKFQNTGNQTLNSFDVFWQVDTSQVYSYSWTGNMIAGASANVTVGSYNFGYGNHRVRVWTSNPNLQSDFNTANDTLDKITLVCGTPLSGTYHIGHQFPANFFSFSYAIHALASCGGITGPVTFLVDSGDYEERLIIPQIAGSSPTNTITFEGATGDSTDVHLWEYSDPLINYTVTFDGADYITVKHMTIATRNFNGDKHAGYGKIVALRNGATNLSFIGNDFVSDQVALAGLTAMDISTDNLSPNCDSLLIDHNHFHRGDKAIYLPIQDTSYPASGYKITNNIIDSCVLYAIYIRGAVGPEISSNKITMDSTQVGIVVFDGKEGCTIEKNKMVLFGDDDGSGIAVSNVRSSSTHPVLVCNNMIYDKIWAHVFFPIGIDLEHIDYAQVWYNTCSIHNGSQGFSPTFVGRLFNQIDVRNNIFITDNWNPASFDTLIGLATYNAYWSYTNHYSTSAPINAQGVVLVEPDFVSTTDLHLNQHTPANDSVIGKGTPIAGITTDIDGDLRDPLHPTIGADEYDSLVFVGIPAESHNSDFTVFPNPAGAFVYVQSPSDASASADVVFELYDLSGRMVNATSLNNSLTQVKTDELSAGFYLYRIVCAGHVLKSGKLVRAGE